MIASGVTAMRKAGIDAQEAQDASRFSDLWPHGIQRVALNDNHLFEELTLCWVVLETMIVRKLLTVF